MDKVTKFLEQHVQWLALALALAYLAYSSYTYLVKEPTSVTIGGAQVVTPGTVDPTIQKGSADKLKRAIDDANVTPPIVAQVLDIAHKSLNEQDIKVIPQMLAWGGTFAPYGSASSGAAVADGPKIKELPNLAVAPAYPSGKSAARWTVIMTPASGQPAAPAAGPDGAPAAPVVPVMQRHDRAYWSGKFVINYADLMKEIARCYSQPNVPPSALQAEFVQVVLLREEKQADGSWSKPVVIENIPIPQFMPYPPGEKPALSPDKLKQALYNYREWFETPQVQDEILRPAFYQTAPDAEPWLPPGDAPPQAQPGRAAPAAPATPTAPKRPFNPATDFPTTPEEARQKQQYQQQQQDSRRQPGGRGPVRPGPNGAGGGYVPPPGYRGPYTGGPARPGFERPANPNYPLRPDHALPPQVNPNDGGAAAPPLNNVPGHDIEILAHDATIQEGKTYRYAVQYKLFNTVWDKSALAVDAVQSKFDIDSPNPADPKAIASAKPAVDANKLWTDPVTVDPLTHIYVTHANANSFANPTAEFVVYSWKNGKWSESPTKKLSPGDVVVGANKSSTPWTVVDIRKDPRAGGAYVILMDDKGALSTRDEASDQQSPELQKLKTEVGAGPAAAAQ